MRLSFTDFLPTIFDFYLVFFATINSVWARRFSDPAFYNGFYQEDQYAKVQMAIGKLDNALKWSQDWPDPSVMLGQVSGVALDNFGQLLIFHRGSHKWDAETFNSRNVYQTIGEPPISESTILVFNKSGVLVDKWGENLFHMPHGITVDKLGNVWVTDVALHQVFKFTPQDRRKPALVLGEKFVPSDDDSHFCKPSAVAVMSSGDFFVADGYCNTRIIKYAADGTKLLQWGRSKGSPEFVFNVPHALTLAEERGLVCVADREHGRAACYRADNGTFVQSFSSWLIGGRLFSVAYAPVHGGRLYIVNGPGTGVPARGYVVDFESGRLIQTFAPPDDFHNPHDIVTSPDGAEVFVAELDPHRVYRFTDDTLRNDSISVGDSKRANNMSVTPVKPTATVESSGTTSTSTTEGWTAWRGALGGAAGALTAALVAGAAVALLRARNRGRKGVTRRRWEYGQGEFKLRRLLERRRFTRVHSEDSDDEPAPMLPPQPPANA